MKRAFLAACVTAVLTGCADRFPGPSATDTERVERRAAECMRARVRDLDDRLSNARVVGNSVVQACRSELQQMLYTATQGQGPAFRRGYEEGFWPDMVEQATVEVLRLRASAAR